VSYYIGIMSGTSLDGIDIAITRFSGAGKFHFIAAQTFPFPEQLYNTLKILISQQGCHFQELGNIDIALGQLIGQSINQLLVEENLTAKDITAIGSHGQTLFHSPTGDFPFSLQIGNANVISEVTGITTVADFRQRDIAAGGQGAPLVPAFHQALFASTIEDRVIVNIGGISNITHIPSDPNKAVIGFDTGPGNVLIDYWTQLHLNKSYDDGGQWAASGKCNDHYLSLLINEPFFRMAAPKSTGRELFNPQWLKQIADKYTPEISAVDVQATLVEFTAQTLCNDIKKYADSSSHIYICGGGAHNDYLLSRLQQLLIGKQLSTTEKLGLNPNWVEACAFAWLAYRTMNKQTGNLPTVTGATHPVVLGAIHPA